MRRLIILIIILTGALHSFCQKPVSYNTSKFDLIEKSKNQKIGSCFLFVIGGVGLLQGLSTFKQSGNLDDAVSGLAVAMLGGTCVLTSIPIYYYASKNKRRAMLISINQQNVFGKLRVNNISGIQNFVLLQIQMGK